MNTENQTAGDCPAERGVRPSCWIRPAWGQTGVANMSGQCPPGWTDTAKPYYSQDALDAAVAAESARCAAMADEYATWGGSNFHKWFKKLAAEIRS